jgi:multiple sugar transport system substrate-binding protein
MARQHGGVGSYAVLKYSKNQDAAKFFLNWAVSDAVWYPLFEVGEAQMSPIAPKQNENAPWSKLDPALRVFREAPANSRAIGWPGQPDQKASLVLAKYIVIDMFGKALLGASPEEAVAWAESEMKEIYG